MYPYLSFFVRYLGLKSTHTRVRTRQTVSLHDVVEVRGDLVRVVGLGWEDDRFVVNVESV